MRGPRAGRVGDLGKKGCRVNVSGRVGQIFGCGGAKFTTRAGILRRIESGLNVSPVAYQQLANGRMALGGCSVQRGPSVFAAGIDLGSKVEQMLDDFFRSAQTGRVERRVLQRRVGEIGIGAGREQHFHNLGVAPRTGNVQRRLAQAGRVDLRPRLEQRPHRRPIVHRR